MNIYKRIMTEFEKMMSGEQFDYSDKDIAQLHAKAFFLFTRINNGINSENYEEMLALQKELLPNMDESAMVLAPFRCDLGFRTKIGRNVVINYNCSFLDNGGITIGDNTLIGPDCHLLTSQHPIDFMERRKPQEKAESITIGNDCWLGGNVTVCPGVTIGDRCIIGAGSVVVKDIPSDSMAVGNPAKVIKRLQ